MKNGPRHRRTGRPPKFTIAQVREALKLGGGIIAAAAKIMNADRGTVASMIEKHQELKDAQAAAREHDLDFCESALREAYGRREQWAVKFFLERQGRHRGWGTTFAQINASKDIKVYLSEEDMRL